MYAALEAPEIVASDFVEEALAKALLHAAGSRVGGDASANLSGRCGL
jgi:hypothetical protein